MGIISKQELLLPIVSGLFIMKIFSVVIQVALYKLKRKRMFKITFIIIIILNYSISQK